MKPPINTIKLFYYVLGLLISLSSYSKTKINCETFDSIRAIFNHVNTPNKDFRYLELTLEQPRIDFNGINSYIDFGDVHDLTSTFTLEAWILQETAVSNGSIISKGNIKAGNKTGYQLAVINNYPNIIWYNASGAALVNLTSQYPITNNKWYHVSATFNGVSIKLYIDGIIVNEVSISTAPLDTAEPFLIGASYDSDTPSNPKNYFNGFIDEVKIWNVDLTEQQIRDAMNQEIEQNGTNVKGKVTQLDISNGLSWLNLKGYYPMNANTADDASGNNIDGVKKNTTTLELQNAPLPYTTKANGSWTDTTASTPWTHGDTVWNLPNGLGVDGTTPVDWNIVTTSHNISSGDKNITLSGLITDAAGTKLSIADPNNPLDETNTGRSLRVTNYLKLIGDIDLVGESQLLQDQGSILDVSSSGKLERDQQGTKDLYTYNYWSSPVGLSNTTSNNNSFKLSDNILKNGTISAAPNNITFLTSGYNGSVSGTNISIADYWIWKFANNLSNSYSAWQHIRRSGTIKIGEGFTMKGVESSPTSLGSTQNYTFYGKPNNGDIALNINEGNGYLIGNPYPSALDANQFIIDNDETLGGTGSATGTLYFWQHWGGGSHVLAEYKGGYASYTLAGGSPAPFMGTPPPGLIKRPGRYIPVAQAFFVTAKTTGTIKFNNGQRVYQNENGITSLFVKPGFTKQSKASAKNDIADSRTKLRLGFNSVNNIRRQILVTADPATTCGYDWGYEAPYIDNLIDDMYWMIEGEKYTIQGINEICESTVMAIGIHTKNDGYNSINLDSLENAPDNMNVIIHDKTLNTSHNLTESSYNTYLPAGEYLNRFAISVSSKELLANATIESTIFEAYYSNETKSIIIHNPNQKTIKSTEVLNILGQTIQNFASTSNQNLIEYKPQQISPGAYIIQIKSDSGIISKKVLIK